jgi:hypothetical protein
MKKTLYFHIGSPKTGTTSIQQFCQMNTIELEKNGLYYPCSKKLTGNRFANGNLLASKRDKIKALKTYFIEFQKSNSKNILLSEEFFFLIKDLSFLDHIKNEGYEIKIICYLRKSVEFMVSFWAEMCRLHSQERSFIQGPFCLSSYLKDDNSYMNALNSLLKLGDYLGNENIIIRPFEKDSFINNDLITDFLSIFNLALEPIYHQPKNINENKRSRKMLDTINLLQVANFGNSFLRNFSSEGEDPKYAALEYEYLLSSIGGELSALESVNDYLLEFVCEKHYPIESELAQRYLGKSDFFISRYPKIYKTNRNAYMGLSNEDLTRINVFVQNQIYSQQYNRLKWLWKLLDKLSHMFK